MRIGEQGGTATHCRFTGNKDNKSHVRGTVCLDSNNAKLTHCVLDHNTLVLGNGRGGGVYLQHGTVENCLIFGNRSTYGGGLAIGETGNSGKVIVRNCTIADNEATANAGGLFLRNLPYGQENRFQNVILAGNKLPNDTLGRAPEWSRENTNDQGLLNRFAQVVENCIFGANEAIGTNSISGDPLFTDPALHDYTLQSVSSIGS